MPAGCDGAHSHSLELWTRSRSASGRGITLTGGDLGIANLGEGSSPSKFICGQLCSCRANEEMRTVLRLLLVRCSWLSAIQGPVRGLAGSSSRLPRLRGASGRAPLENIIYRSDRLPTLILRMGI